MISGLTSAAPRYAARVAHYPPGATFGPRVLRDYELVWILSGSATWEYRHPGLRDVTRHELRPGHVIIAGTGGTDSYFWDEHRSSSHAYIHFDLQNVGRSADGWPLVRGTGQTDVVWALCTHLLELSNRDDQPMLAETQRALVVLLEAAVGGRSSAPDPRVAGGPIAVVLSHVRDRWRNDGLQIVPVGELAAAAGLTNAHLSRVFSRAFGQGLSASLELVRLGRAAIELQRSNLTLEEIARQAGFANPYHFSRRFSRAYGMPPGRFRRTAHLDALAPVSAVGLIPLWNALQ